MKIEDADYIQHSSDLNKSHLKLNAWLTEPLENPLNNFVDSLLSRYLQDLQQRNKFNIGDKKNFAIGIRRVVKLTSLKELI